MKSIVSWCSIPSIDFDRAVKFYEEVLDITMTSMGEGDDRMAPFWDTEDAPGAGVTADPTFRPTSDGVRLYLDADGAIDDILGRVVEAGGEVLVPKTSMGDHWSYGLFRDTEGNSIWLHSK